MWKLDLSALTPRKKIHFLLVNAYTYFWLLVLTLHILPFIWDGELCNHDASQSLSGCTKGWLPRRGQGTGSPGGSLGAQRPRRQAPSLRGWPQRTQPRAVSGLSRAPGRAGDLPGPGSLTQQETRTGLETWLQPESKICPGERDGDGAEPRLPSCTTGAGSEGPGWAEVGVLSPRAEVGEASGDAGQEQ